MRYPLHKVKNAEKRHGLMNEDDQGSGAEKDTFVAKMPKDLTIRDCLVDSTRHATIEDQRTYFCKRMLKMAREGHDKEDGWTISSKTQMAGLPHGQQLDVYERRVPWSKAKQLRSVVQTTFTCDDVFGWLLAGMGVTMGKAFQAKLSKAQREAFQAAKHYPFVDVGENSATTLMLRDLPFPWPFTPRYLFIVQDYVRVAEDSNGDPCVFTYNHVSRSIQKANAKYFNPS